MNDQIQNSVEAEVEIVKPVTILDSFDLLDDALRKIADRLQEESEATENLIREVEAIRGRTSIRKHLN